MTRWLAATAVAAALALLGATASPAAAEGCRGDPNKDKAINALDALLILQYVAEVYDPGLIVLHPWDADDDQDVTSLDALLVLQVNAGLLEIDCL